MKYIITWTALFDTVVEVPDGYYPEDLVENIDTNIAGSSYVKHTLQLVEAVPKELNTL